MTFRHIFWPALPAFTLGAVIGAASGGALVVEPAGAWVRIGVGAFVMWSVLGRPARGVRDWPVLVGAVSSFLTMFFGATGSSSPRSRNARAAAPRPCRHPARRS